MTSAHDDALARLRDLAESLGLTTLLLTHPEALLLMYRDDTLVGTYVKRLRAVILQPGNVEVACDSWKAALRAAAERR